MISMHTNKGAGAQSNDRVVLNVGGKRFETLIDTLRKYPSTMLGAMFSSSFIMATPDEKGEYFFDRDPKVFQVILNFYRHGKIIVPQNMCPEMVKEELDFFGINTDETPEGIGLELKREADTVATCKLYRFLEDFLVPRLKAQAKVGHYSCEIGFVPEKHSMNNMTNLPSLSKNSDYFELFAEKENRRKLTQIMASMKLSTQWDRSEQVNINTKEYLFECFKLTTWWNGENKQDGFLDSPVLPRKQSFASVSLAAPPRTGTAAM